MVSPLAESLDCRTVAARRPQENTTDPRSGLGVSFRPPKGAAMSFPPQRDPAPSRRRRQAVPSAALGLVLGGFVLGSAMLPARAQTTGLTPLSDLGSGHYQGYQGGLYPGGTNAPPAAHRTAALAMAA